MDNVLPISQAATAPAPPLNQPASAYLAASHTALGGRSVEALPHYDFVRLLQGCENPNVLPNGGGSTGSSPILRELLHESGAVYQVTREFFDDGEPGGHQGGNALDISALHPLAVTAIFRAAPELVDTFAFQSPFASESLFIRDGVITTGAVLAGLIDVAGATMHISSSLHRLVDALTRPAVRNALTVSATGQFANREVYVTPRPGPVVPAHWSETDRKPVHFW